MVPGKARRMPVIGCRNIMRAGYRAWQRPTRCCGRSGGELYRDLVNCDLVGLAYHFRRRHF
jgi:hypothetical protein